MKITPTGHRLLVKPDNLETADPLFRTAKAAGLVIPDMAERMEQTAIDTGIILDVGPNCWKAFDDGKPWASIGDKVIYAKYGGKLVKDGEEKFLLLNDEDVLGVITNE